MTKSNTHVVLLKGGLSAEREVSLMSSDAIARALEELGYQVTQVDMGRDVAAVLTGLKPDVVFNGLYGNYGEDGCVQGLLEILGIPYTHSGVLASALAMDKQESKHIFESVGILCPDGREVYPSELQSGEDPMPRPFIIKPVSDGSSVGVYIIDGDKPLPGQAELEAISDRFLVEQYIPGKELSVAVLDDGPLGVLELAPKEGFYDYKNKYTDGMTVHIMPADISDAAYQEAMEVAYKAHLVLRCNGISRADFRYDHEGDGRLYLLEVNTQPGMTPLSIAPEIARHRGMSFNDLIEYLVQRAICEKNA